MNVHSIWVGNKTSDVNKCLQLFINSTIIVYDKLEFDETINANTLNAGIEWHGTCTLQNDVTFMVFQPGNGKMNCFGAVVFVQETQTKNVLELRGQLKNTASAPHSGDHNPIYFPDVRYVLDVNVAPLPNCIGLFIGMDKTYSSGYLYNKTIYFNARSINTAVAFGFESFQTNLGTNVYNIVSWWCTNSVRYLKNELYTRYLDNGSVFNLMVEPNRIFEKVILVDNYEHNNTSVGECIYNLWVYDTYVIPSENLNKLIDISARCVYNDMLYSANTIGTVFNQNIGQSRLLLTTKGPMLPHANATQIVSNYLLIRDYIIANITDEDSRQVALQKFIYNILSLKTGQLVCFSFPFSTQYVDSSTEYDSVYKIEILRKAFSKIFSDEEGNFVGDTDMTGMLTIWFVPQDAARYYERVIFSFETIYNRVQFQVGMKLAPSTVASYSDINIKDITDYIFTSNITDETYDKGYNYKGKFSFSNNMPAWFDGEKYIDAEGVDVSVNKSGTTEQRPTNVSTGFQYFDTTLNKPIWKTASGWVDATGAEV